MQYYERHADRVLLLVCALGSFAILLFWLNAIALFGVDLPRHDQWSQPFLIIAKDAANTLEWVDLSAQHNEARKLVPNLLSLALTYTQGTYDVHSELYLGLALSSILSILVFIVLRIALKDVVAAAVLTLFFVALSWAPGTAKFHLWSINFERFLPEIALLTGMIANLLIGLGPVLVFVLLALSAFAIYSFPSGLVIGPLFFGLVLVAGAGTLRQRVVWAAILLIGCALLTASFFAAYAHPAAHSPLPSILEQPIGDILAFFFRFLGNPLSDDDTPARMVGAAMSIGFVGLFFWRWRAVDSTSSRAAVLSLAAMAGYSFFQAALATLARLPMGAEHAGRPEYVTHPLPLSLAVGALLLMSVPRRWAVMSLGVKASLAAIGIVIVVVTIRNDHLRVYMEHSRQSLVHQRACLMLNNFVSLDACLSFENPDFWLDGLGFRWDAYEDFGYRLDIVKESRIVSSYPRGSLAIGDPASGCLDSVERIGGRTVFSGWAVLDGEPADAVIVATDGFPDRGRILDVAPGRWDESPTGRLFAWRSVGNPVQVAFDPEFYLAQNPDVAASDFDPFVHFMQHGWIDGRAPSPHFDAADYLSANPDLAQRPDLNPFEHFVLSHVRESGAHSMVDSDALGWEIARRDISAIDSSTLRAFVFDSDTAILHPLGLADTCR